MSLLGSLEEVSLGDVFRMLREARKTGILTVNANAAQALLRFHNGDLVHASAGRLSGEDAVLDLFGWKAGQITFLQEERPSPVPANVSRSVPELIEEGMRVGEARHKLHALISSDRVVFQLALGPADESTRVSIGAKEWRVIRLLDAVRDVREVAEASRLPKPEVCRILFDLTEAGFLQRVEVQKVLRVQHAGGLFSKDAAEIDERLREEWTRAARFETGVPRVQVRTLGGRSAIVNVSFRAGLGRDIHLPRATLTELAVRDGEDVHVRPLP